MGSEKFVTCPNAINSKQLLVNAAKELDTDLQEWLGTAVCFATFGRLSPEKAPAKLIRAFSVLSAEHPEAKLVILGQGPLHNELQKLVNALNMQRHIKLGGQRATPFPLLRRADCFVLSSDHERQSMVLLEAMVLHKAIIATDIPGNRSMVENGYGLLVDNSEKGLLDGLLRFFQGQIQAGQFDVERYNQTALATFHNIVGGQVRADAFDFSYYGNKLPIVGI